LEIHLQGVSNPTFQLILAILHPVDETLIALSTLEFYKLSVPVYQECKEIL
jgi:hypothetical protein